MPSRYPRLSRRTYLTLTGGGFAALAGCQDGTSDSSGVYGTDRSAESNADEVEDGPDVSDQSPATESAATDSPTTESTATDSSEESSTAGVFPIPPSATESDLTYVLNLGGMLPNVDYMKRAETIGLYVDAPSGLEKRGYEVDDPKGTLSWFDENIDGWSLEREEKNVTIDRPTDAGANEAISGMSIPQSLSREVVSRR